jgi:hypothetical protein
MSLSVRKCVLTDDDWEIVDEPDHSQTLAGFERWRVDVWGSPIIIALGCTSLPQLRHHDVYCFGDDVHHLLNDTHLILNHLTEIAQATNTDEETIAYRTRNIREAALWACENGGGVIIW